MSGEKPGGREAMDRLTKRIVDHGGSAKFAREQARRAALQAFHGERQPRRTERTERKD